MRENESGQSILEVIVAVAIFVMLASTSVIVIIGSLSMSRLSEEETKAAAIAKEGLSAVESIRNRSWGALVNGDHGLTNISGFWELDSDSDVDGSGKFTRVITIEDINRDGNGDIATSGSVDHDSKLVTSTVTWSFTSSRESSVTMTTLLTKWQQSTSTEQVSPTPTPPSFNSCEEFCSYSGYSSGVCRANANQCVNSGEVHESEGDKYCPGPGSSDTCCCLP